MRKVFTLEAGKLGIALPNKRRGWINKKPQGGNAPVPFRQHSGNFGRANTFARVPQQGAWLD
jgi:hypothetical protein